MSDIKQDEEIGIEEQYDNDEMDTDTRNTNKVLSNLKAAGVTILEGQDKAKDDEDPIEEDNIAAPQD